MLNTPRPEKDNDRLAELLTQYILDNHEIELADPVIDDNGLTAQYQNNEVVISLTFIRNEITGECCDIELYSDDIPELYAVSIDCDDTDNDELYAEVNEMNGIHPDMDDYMRNEEDDDEDRGQSL